MKWILFLLIIILVIFVALLIFIMNKHTTIVGGAETIEEPLPLALDILNSFDPYLRDIENPKNVIEYLKVYRKVKSPLSKTQIRGVSKKSLPLYHMIEQLIYDNNINSVRDFWRKTEINYMSFIPKAKANTLREQYKKPKNDDIRKMMRDLDEYLINYGKHLSDTELKDLAESLLTYNRLYKPKRTYAKFSASRLRKMLKTNSDDILIYDILPILMRLEPCSVDKQTTTLPRPVPNLREILHKLEDLTPRDIHYFINRVERKTLLDDLERERKRLEKEKSKEERKRLEEKITQLTSEIEKIREMPMEPRILASPKPELKLNEDEIPKSVGKTKLEFETKPKPEPDGKHKDEIKIETEYEPSSDDIINDDIINDVNSDTTQDITKSVLDELEEELSEESRSPIKRGEENIDSDQESD